MVDLKKWSLQVLKGAGGRILAALGSARTGTSKDDSEADQQSKSSAGSAPPVREPEAFSFSDARKEAQVFGAKSCPWSGRAMRLFESAGIEATYLDLDHPGSDTIREELRVETGQLTLPYIYLRGQFIGGFNALDEVYRLGQLPYYVLPEAERLAHPDHGKIEIAPRMTNVDGVDRPPE